MTQPTHVEAYGPSGQIQVIPLAWLDHPIFGKQFKASPRTKAALAQSDSASDDETTPDDETRTTAPPRGGNRAARTAATTTQEEKE